jgi:HPt (histidine-containing phosphotransfer) domain-containing protein
MRELLAGGKPVDAAGLAHALKGASAQLGVLGIAKQAALLENAIKSGAEDGAMATLLKQTEERCGIVCASIHRLDTCVKA